jgi:hypothetical protein
MILRLPCPALAGRRDVEIRLVLDLAGGVARRLVDIHDRLVARVGGIELALERAFDALVGAGIAERGAVRERLDGREADLGDAGRGGGGDEDERAGERGCDDGSMHGLAPPPCRLSYRGDE